VRRAERLKPARIAVVGAGAIGGWIAARLALAGHAVSVLARGRTLEAIARDGVRLDEGGRLRDARVAAAADPGELGVQQVVVVALKQPALAAVLPRIGTLIDPGTLVVTAMNGVPWWFFDDLGGASRGLRLASVDPHGALRAAVPSALVVGGVVHATCSSPEPGAVRHGQGNGLILGAALDSTRPRVPPLAELLAGAGFDAAVSDHIQQDIWYKLWGNMTMNPVSALTGASADRILDDDFVRDLCLRAMAEAAAIGARIGCPIVQSGADRIAVTRKLGAFKTSMLQDVEAGKPLEIEALLGAVHEIGAHVAVPTPTVDALLGLTRLFARERGLAT